MHPTTERLLALTEQDYDKYNDLLAEIKAIFDEEQLEAFERVMHEELSLTTARRAYQSAIKIAMGEQNVYREWRPAETLAAKFNKR